MIDWCGYNWLESERYGKIHPEKGYVWYDPDCIKVHNESELSLDIKKSPQEVTYLDETYYPQLGMGLISCTEKFTYGTFELEVKLPNGPYSWGAFWMWSFESYPPEIDIFESYNNRRGNYFRWQWTSLLGRFWRVNTNVHLGEPSKNSRDSGNGRYKLGAKGGWLGFKSPQKRFNKYKLEWFPDRISIYYNNTCVREVTDPLVLEQFKGKTMNVIINNHPLPDFTINDTSRMEVRNFSYQPY